MAVTPASSLVERSRRVLPGGVNSGQRLVPRIDNLVIAATSRATFTDAEAGVYTDYHAAFGPPLLGHNDALLRATETAVSGVVARRD